MDKIAFFLPARKGSERVKNKNTRSFAGIEGGLVENKIRQLLSTKHVDEIILSTNDEVCMEVAQKFTLDSRLRIVARPDNLCLSSTNLQDLICYVPTITDADHILWGHVTTPLAGANEYDKGIELYLSKLHEGYDSLVGVTELKNFLLNREGKLINNTTNIPWPRTQDLEPLYEINHTMFLAKREVYIEQKNRIGVNPMLHVMDEIHSFDIDWEDDFTIAEVMYKSVSMKKVVTFGEIMLRLGAPDYLRLTQCHQLDMTYAGAEANVAVSLSNYGIAVDYITRLPDNPIADKCIMELLSHRVGIDHVIRGGERIGILYLETGSNARPSRIFYDRANSSLATIELGVIDWKEIFKDACWFHWTGITPALSENAAKVCLEAIQAANEMNITVSCDINYRANLWHYGKTAAQIMTRLVEGCDVIIGNEEDCEKVFGIKPENFDAGKTNGKVNQSAFESVCHQMMNRFTRCKIMAVTLRGAINANHNTWRGILCDAGTFYHSKIYDITDVVDRVGGGDSFMGALIYGLLTYTDNKQKALDFAVAASCLKHTIKGDYNIVTKQEVENLMDGDGSGRVKR